MEEVICNKCKKEVVKPYRYDWILRDKINQPHNLFCKDKYLVK